MGALIFLLLVITRRIQSEAIAQLKQQTQTIEETVDPEPDTSTAIPPLTASPQPHQEQQTQPAADVAAQDAIVQPVPDESVVEPPPADPLDRLNAADYAATIELPEIVHKEPAAVPDPNNSLRSEIAQLTAAQQDQEKQLQTVQEKVRIEQQAISEQEARLNEVTARLRALHEKQSAFAIGKDQQQRKVAATLASIQDAKNRIRTAKQNRAVESKFAFLPYDGNSGTARRPILIECTGDGFRFIPEDVQIKKEDLAGFVADYNPLLSGVEELIRYWRVVDDLEKKPNQHNEPYVLLIVRPSGTLTFYAARNALAKLNSSHGYELVSEDFPLDLPAADSNAVSALQDQIQRTLAARDALARRMNSSDTSNRGRGLSVPGDDERESQSGTRGGRRIVVGPNGVRVEEDDPHRLPRSGQGGDKYTSGNGSSSESTGTNSGRTSFPSGRPSRLPGSSSTNFANSNPSGSPSTETGSAGTGRSTLPASRMPQPLTTQGSARADLAAEFPGGTGQQGNGSGRISMGAQPKAQARSQPQANSNSVANTQPGSGNSSLDFPPLSGGTNAGGVPTNSSRPDVSANQSPGPSVSSNAGNRSSGQPGGAQTIPDSSAESFLDALLAQENARTPQLPSKKLSPPGTPRTGSGQARNSRMPDFPRFGHLPQPFVQPGTSSGGNAQNRSGQGQSGGSPSGQQIVQEIRRGRRRWGNQRGSGSIGFERELTLHVDGKQMWARRPAGMLKPSAQANAVEFAQATVTTPVDHLVADAARMIDGTVRQWDKPPQGFYWIPVVRFEIQEEGRDVYQRLKRPLQKLGLQIEAPGLSPYRAASRTGGVR